MSPVRSPREAVRQWAETGLRPYLEELGQPVQVKIERPRQPEHGDFALNLAMQLARPARRPPRQLAEEMVGRLAASGPIGEVSVAGPGFINLRLDRTWMLARLRDVVEAGPHWGRQEFGSGQRVNLEFVSANPTGPLLISHGRGAVVGDTLARLLAFTGHSVDREFYLNDAGRQVAVFADSLLAKRRGEAVGEEGYGGEYVRELASELPAELADGRDRQAVIDWTVRRYRDQFESQLARLGIVFDTWFSERQLYGDWERETLGEVRRRGVIAEHDGATWMRLPDGKEDVLYKSSGEGTYFLGDLLYHRDKLVRRGFDRALLVWGADHQNQVRRLTQAVEYFGRRPDQVVVVLVQMVRMRSAGEFVRISKRAGNVLLLDDLVEEVGPDAVRYHYLLRSADAPMDFDLDLAREQSNENPVFYAQYAHARLCSVAAVAAETGLSETPTALERLTQPAEVGLVREVMEFPDTVEEAARRLEPHRLPYYAHRLAERVHAFYHAGNSDARLRIICPDAELSAARLYLAAAARQTIANALNLMGVSAPTRM